MADSTNDPTLHHKCGQSHEYDNPVNTVSNFTTTRCDRQAKPIDARALSANENELVAQHARHLKLAPLASRRTSSCNRHRTALLADIDDLRHARRAIGVQGEEHVVPREQDTRAAGSRSVYLVPCTGLGVSGISRWSSLRLWVTDDMRISANFGVAELVVTVMVDPVVALAGAILMTGRRRRVPLALKRYGGEKICPSGWFVVQPSPHSPPPPEKTRPSGSKIATLW